VSLPGINYTLDPLAKKNLTVIEVGPYGENGQKNEINKFLNTNIANLTRVNSYLFVHSALDEAFKGLSSKKPFIDPCQHSSSQNSSLAIKLNLDFDYAICGTLKPGTSDAEGNVALEQAMIASGQKLQDGDVGFLAQIFYLKGNVEADNLKKISALLFNPELYETKIFSSEEVKSGAKMPVPLVILDTETKVEKIPVLSMNDEELLKLNSRRKLAATLEEMQGFQAVYKDEKFLAERRKHGLDNQATDVEIETWFGLRSEHCFHKEFNAEVTLQASDKDYVFNRALQNNNLTKKNNSLSLENGIFKTFIAKPAKNVFERLEKRGNNWIASMFKDNSGVVYYDQDFMYCIKVETHNSPSNIEPVQGAKTGLNGNFRDIMGTMQGSFDILAGFFYYCTGNPKYQGWLPKGVKHPYTILKGITRGVREAGNEMQVPTVTGGVVCDPRYIAKCLVYCGAVGWSPVKLNGRDLRTKEPGVGDRVFVAGQPVGIDGIHGATESSLSASSSISLGHVQADFSFIQSKVKDLVLTAARKGLFSAVTDCGAMGIGSASHEIAGYTGGLSMDLANHPVKYKGIQPWQINCSETQDRMLLVVPPANAAEFEKLAEFYNVEISDLGELTDSGNVELKYKGNVVGLIDIEKLFDKNPVKQMSAYWPDKTETALEQHELDLGKALLKVLARPDVASKEWFFRQKDSSVKGGTILGPSFGRKLNVDSDAAIHKPLETEGRDFGAIAYAISASPKLSDIDSYFAAQKSFVDAVGKVVALGVALPDLSKPKWDAWAICGNYCQPNSDSNYTLSEENGRINMAKLLREGQAVAELVERLNVPVISGKDSMKCSCVYSVPDNFTLNDIPADLREHIFLKEENGVKKIEIHDPPTYLLSVAAKVEDYRKTQNAEFKFEGDFIYVLGSTKAELGASAYAEAAGYELKGRPLHDGFAPKVNLEEFVKISECLVSAVNSGLLASSAYIHNGGIATAVSKAAIASGLGAEICMASDKIREEIFSETPGRFLISCSALNKDKVEEHFKGLPLLLIGKVAGQEFKIGSSVQLKVSELEKAYCSAFDFGGWYVEA
jgi:phosphoribosylformylglycinamidine (FGAM) synthase-like enzyme